MKKAAIGRGEENFSLRHRGRTVDPAQLIVKPPFFFTGCSIQRVHVRIAATGINRAVNHGGRGLEAYLVVNQRVLATVKPPPLLSGGRINSVEITVPAPEKDLAISIGR